MKVSFIILANLVLLVVIHKTEGIRENHSGSKSQRQGQNNAAAFWKRSSLHKSEQHKRLKEATEHKMNDVAQSKRQFVPGLPCLNCPFPHIHRIIVHHHPGRSNVSGKWLMKGHILPAVKIGHPMIFGRSYGRLESRRTKKSDCFMIYWKRNACPYFQAAIKLLSYKERLSR